VTAVPTGGAPHQTTGPVEQEHFGRLRFGLIFGVGSGLNEIDFALEQK
jgi:hypothetical protein